MRAYLAGHICVCENALSKFACGKPFQEGRQELLTRDCEPKTERENFAKTVDVAYRVLACVT